MTFIDVQDSQIQTCDYAVNTGGNIFVDIIRLKNGQLLVVGDETICLYKDEQAFNDGIILDEPIFRINPVRGQG